MQLNVLLVEDELGIREGLAKFLMLKGIRVTTAESRAAGVAALAADDFDVVVTDWRLGDGLGADIVAACDVPVVVASGVPARDYAGLCDSAWVDLSKGLGCPIGAVLCGSAEFIEEAWRWKHQFGGAMRQAGIVAAAGVYALENNVERLAEDHANARLLADRLAEVPGIAIDPGLIIAI